MKQQQAEILIEAPIKQVYAFITDWRKTPLYERLVVKIETVRDAKAKGQCLAQSQLKVLGFKLKYLYRYWFVPPTRYGGAQVEGLIRGGFWFKLTETESGTKVLHGEFIASRWKVLETITAFVLWRVLFRADLEHQLIKLKALIERVNPSQSHLSTPPPLSRLAGNSLLN